MPMMTRRGLLLQSIGLAAALAAEDKRTNPASFSGVFPILMSPFLESGPLDVDALVRQVAFSGKCGTPGVVWPQLASEYASLKKQERLEGAGAVVKAARDAGVVSVIGVQAATTAEAVAYAEHAAKLAPDAIIAIPLREEKSIAEQREYYKAIGKACPLPMFVQAIGDMTVDFLLDLSREIPHFRYVKDEAGHTLSRISEFRKRDDAKRLSVFTGGHGKTMLDEMARGSKGTMPVPSFGDLYVKAWTLWESGEERQAQEVMARASLLIHQVTAYGLPSMKYILHRRGVFRNWQTRQKENHFDREGQEAIDRSLEFVRDDLVAFPA